MTKEEKIDWLYRLRSEIYVYMPKEWLIPMNDALDAAIEKLKQEPNTKNDKVDCKHTDCKNCVNHKYCDYELSKSEIPTSSTTKNNLAVEHHKQNIQTYAHDFGVSEEQAETELRVTKNNLGVDKEQLKTMIRGLTKWYVKRDNTEVGEPNTAVGLLYDDVMFGIDRLPSVTPQEPRKGHWIEYSWNDNGLARWGLECDKCHKKYKYGGEIWNNPNYCPNCGARMTESKEQE